MLLECFFTAKYSIILILTSSNEKCDLSKFSFINLNDTVIFNNNVLDIEDYFNKFNKTDYKFVALTKDEWKKHKKEFITNKEKKYVYIEENTILNDEKDIKNKNIAEDIFGDDIIEVR